VALVLREQNTDSKMFEAYSQILRFYPPTTVLHLGPGSSGMYLGLITLTFSPGGIEENIFIPLLVLHMVLGGQDGKKHLTSTIDAIFTVHYHLPQRQEQEGHI
jgi:hypothetical protein